MTTEMDGEKSAEVSKVVLQAIIDQPISGASVDDIIGGLLIAVVSLVDRTVCPACKQDREFSAANLFLRVHGIEVHPATEHEHTGEIEAEEEYAGHA